jgi:hypothetical protein
VYGLSVAQQFVSIGVEFAAILRWNEKVEKRFKVQAEKLVGAVRLACFSPAQWKS